MEQRETVVENRESRLQGASDEEVQICALLEQLAKSKKEQRAIEERLLHALSRPTHRQWIHERILDQYKHEKMLVDIATSYFSREIDVQSINHAGKVRGSMHNELNKRLEAVESNILFMSDITQALEDFKLYKMFNSMICDEYMYQNRLLRIICE